MKIYDFVELISSLDYLKEKGILKGSKGTIIELKNNNAFVVFFNVQYKEIKTLLSILVPQNRA